MKRPEECRNITDVREAIDTLDRKILGLIGQRAKYVEAAARFKSGEESVRAPDRQRAMLEARRKWAEEEDLNPEVIEKIYRDLVSYFVDRELEDRKQTGR